MLVFFVLLTLPSFKALSQDQRALISAFESASREFNVPPEVVKGIAFAETRWQHLQWPDGDTASCVGMPHAYGVMSLRDDNWFGHSLREGALLIHQDVNVVRKDLVQNIRAAAALLKQFHDTLPLPGETAATDIESWENSIAAYCGIPQPELAHQHALDIFERVVRGYNEYGIQMQPRFLSLAGTRQRVTALWQEADQKRTTGLQKTANQPDYPGAKWAPAYPNHWYTEGYSRDFVIIHDMEGYYLGTISYFQQQSTSASIHYCMNGLQDNSSDSPAGEITQMIEEKYWAWHVVCWNKYTLGIEHEGFAGNPAWFTPEMYLASSKLTRYMCDKYGIPKDRNHIVGHGEWQNGSWVNWINTVYKQKYPSFDVTCNDHTDPGPYWDWDFYMQLVKQDSTLPRIVSQPPGSRVQVSDNISVTFSERMEPSSTQKNFTISPAVQGVFSWTNNSRTLNFTPTTFFEFAKVYTVTIDTGAHNYFNGGLDVNGDGIGGDRYSFTFQTVDRDTIPPQLVSLYPGDNDTDVSRSAEIAVDFNEPLDPSTLANAFTLREAGGNAVTLTTPTSTSGPGYTHVRFRPTADLKPLTTYQLTVNQQAKDFGGNSITAVRTLSFTTEAVVSFSGKVIDAVDQTGGWWQPSTSGSTINVQGAFAISTDILKGGAGSGKITYTFTQASGGYLRDHNSSTPSIEGGNLFGIWVYGDRSGNQLEYWFYYNKKASYIVLPVGIINWTGWKLKTVQISQVPVGDGTGRQFASFGIRQVAGAQLSGTVYLDELTVGNTVTGVESPAAAALPSSFALHQNYPNPFNPSTSISFDVPKESHVVLRIFNTLGQEVRTLVDDSRPAGRYIIQVDASALPSGVYFYRLEGSGFTDVKKMVLLR